MKWVISTAVVAIATLLGSQVSSASIWAGDNSGNLATVDPLTGATTPIGNTGFALTDIAFHPSGSPLYGITFTSLYTINPNTAAPTLIGSHGMGGAGNALAVSSGGTIYGASNNSTSLFTVNPGGGGAVVGDMGVASAGDLEFHGGTLYLSGSDHHLYSVNPANGAAFDIGAFTISNVFGLASEGGVLYGLSGTSVYTINTATGAATYQSTTSGLSTIWGASPPPVPEPTTFAVWSLLGLAAGTCWRRRKNKM